MAKAPKPDGRRVNGRPKGSRNKRTEQNIKKAQKGGIMPLDFMLKQMRDEKNDLAVRMAAAQSAAPYVHSRLQTLSVSGNIGLITQEDALKALKD
jgi:hypothetical protein